ncbi:MetQ/NlpA family ABC transporter substrate-binding protein, partial [Paenibacillus xylanexedens]|uniref:MetQ/NlpA family ABC transporter substrate-binding protein n=1 Tax=Paenibacillus xylanexedens TaxID=528191 RepID=UPI0034D9671A
QHPLNLQVLLLSHNLHPNTPLPNNQLHPNFFHHLPYITQYNQPNNPNLLPLQPIYNPIYARYSNNYKSIHQLPQPATIPIPNHPSNIPPSLL